MTISRLCGRGLLIVAVLSVGWLGSAQSRTTQPGAKAPGKAPAVPEDPVVAIQSTFLEIQSRYVERAEKAKSFEIDEKGANQYLRHRAKTDLKQGISNPWIRFEKEVAVIGARIDLDALKSDMPDSLMLRLLSGVVPVEIEAKLVSKAGKGNILLERVTVAGVELPTSFVEELAKQHDTTSFLPPGFRLGESFPLPYDLEEIRLVSRLVRIKQRGARPASR